MMNFHQMPLGPSPFCTPPEASFATQPPVQQSPFHYRLEAPTSQMFPAPPTYQLPPKPPPPTAPSTQVTQHSTSGQEPTDEHQIEPLPLSSSNNVAILPSSAINKEKLIPVQDVIAKYYKIKGESKAGALACKIAREAIFGKAVMKRCTPLGNRELPGLPSEELFQLKKHVLHQFPQYWRNPVEFEGLWKKCLEAVQQACKRMRQEKD